MEFKVTVEHRKADDYLVPPFIIDKPPRYFILGGMVLQELSIPHLLAYGSNWPTKAPHRLVHYARKGSSDDEEGIRNLLKMRFEYAGYKCLVAKDGSEGTKVAKKEKPSLIIMDLVMPNNNQVSKNFKKNLTLVKSKGDWMAA